ncbi:hypothetical protein [Streptomyces adelaidensis]|nr:hypothetical protein [Streptomyces adelaidensis]
MERSAVADEAVRPSPGSKNMASSASTSGRSSASNQVIGVSPGL